MSAITQAIQVLTCLFDDLFGDSFYLFPFRDVTLVVSDIICMSFESSIKGIAIEALTIFSHDRIDVQHDHSDIPNSKRVSNQFADTGCTCIRRCETTITCERKENCAPPVITTICSPQSNGGGPNNRLPWFLYNREYHLMNPWCVCGNMSSCGKYEFKHSDLQNADTARQYPALTTIMLSGQRAPWK